MELNKVSALLLATSLIINVALSLVGPFFPPEAEKKGLSINVIGYVFSAYPLSFVIVSLIVPKILHYYSQKKLFMMGSILYALSVIGFGLVIYLPDNIFLYFALACRVLQGGSNAAVYTTAYSVFSMQYQGQDIMQINSYFKSTLGVGLVTGLLLGTVLFMIGGYTLPFIIFGLFFLGFIPCVIDYFPDKIGENEDENESLCTPSEEYDLRVNGEYLKYKDEENRLFTSGPVERTSSWENPKQNSHLVSEAFQDPKSAEVVRNSDMQMRSPEAATSPNQPKDQYEFANVYVSEQPSLMESLITQTIVKCLLLSVLFLSLLNFAPAILSKRLAELNIHKYWYGLVFAIPWVVPVASIFIANKFMKKCNGNAVILTGTVILAIGFYVVSIASKGFFLIGISMLGFSAPFVVLPLFPMMRNSIAKSDKDSESVVNALSGLYNAALGIGAIIGPLIGANLYFYFGFETTAISLGNAWIILSIMLFLSGGCWRSNEPVEELNSNLSFDLPDYHNQSFITPSSLQLKKPTFHRNVQKHRFNSS